MLSEHLKNKFVQIYNYFFSINRYEHNYWNKKDETHGQIGTPHVVYESFHFITLPSLGIIFASLICFHLRLVKIKIHLFVDHLHFFFHKSPTLPTFLVRWSSFLKYFKKSF